MRGTVIKSTGSWYSVRLDDRDEVWQCRIVGKLRLDDLPLTNPVAVGDYVEVDPEIQEGQGDGLIKKIYPRRNFVARQSPRRKHDLHLLASNIDQAVLIVTMVHPTIKIGFIDRFLLMTERFELPVTLVFNKVDLYTDEDLAGLMEVREVYEKIGYTVLATSVAERRGLEAFRDMLAGKLSLLSGQSGVGKSSLVNAVEPKLTLRTGEISNYSGKGQHTTTFAEMFDLSFGGRIIDTPGMKMLAFNDKDPQNVAHSFREFFRLSVQCRFGGSCMHCEEPGCAVRAAVQTGEVSALRYANYRGILEEIADINYWERYKEI